MRLSLTALLVRDYDEAIAFYVDTLGFTLVEDTYQPAQDKRWVVVAPPGGTGTTLLLAKASKPEQEPFIGNQAGGRVFLFAEIPFLHDLLVFFEFQVHPHDAFAP